MGTERDLGCFLGSLWFLAYIAFWAAFAGAMAAIVLGSCAAVVGLAT
jgi:hypothetical protein